MRRLTTAWMLALAVSTTGAAAEHPASPANLPEPITTRQTVFSIPFRIDRVQNPMQQPVEVQLHVSANRGMNWQMVSRISPEQGKFLFRAVADGEYWFSIRTLDRSGQARPDGSEGPGLRVLVDTTLPDLQLDARQGEAGQIVLSWQVAEPHLDLSTLKIQYRSELDRSWRPVAIDRGRINTTGATSMGEVVWWPEGRVNRVEIRAEVADTAGNSAVSHSQVSLNRVASTDAAPPHDPAGRLPGRRSRRGPAARLPVACLNPRSRPGVARLHAGRSAGGKRSDDRAATA